MNPSDEYLSLKHRIAQVDAEIEIAGKQMQQNRTRENCSKYEALVNQLVELNVELIEEIKWRKIKNKSHGMAA